MLDFVLGESRCEVGREPGRELGRELGLELGLELVAVVVVGLLLKSFPLPYTDLLDGRLASRLDCLSGVKGDESRFTGTVDVLVRWRGEGVKGIRPPAVRVLKSPLWDLMGVDTAAEAMLPNVDCSMCDRWVPVPAREV